MDDPKCDVDVSDDSPGTPLGRWKALCDWAETQDWFDPVSAIAFESQLIHEVLEKDKKIRRLEEEIKRKDYIIEGLVND